MEKTIIKAESSSWLPDFGELYRLRKLLFSLAWRDIRVKYAQTFIGLTRAFIDSIFNLLILSFVFGKGVQVETSSRVKKDRGEYLTVFPKLERI
jgi:lipopolysaccharide transport system permease protein